VAFFLGFLLCAVIAAVSVTLGSGSSLRGGIGANRVRSGNGVRRHQAVPLGHWQPGRQLSAVKFPARGKTVDVSVGLGHLTVEVPSNAVVNVNAHAGVGEVDVFGNSGGRCKGNGRPKALGAVGLPAPDA